MANSMPHGSQNQEFQEVNSLDSAPGHSLHPIYGWYGDLVELAGLGIWVFDADGHTTYVNRSMAEMLGRTVEEMMTLPVSTFSDEEALVKGEEYRQRRKQWISEGYEFKLLHRDGSEVWVYISATPILNREGQYHGAVAMLMNITKQKSVEAERDRNYTLLRVIMDNAQDSIFVKDKDGRYLLANAAAIRTLGAEGKQLVGRSHVEFFPSEGIEKIKEIDHQVLQSGQTVISEMEMTLSGIRRTFLATKTPYRDADGEVIGLVGIAHDITKRKQAEDDLRQSEERYRAIIENIQDGYFEVNLKGDLIFGNGAFYRMMEASDREMVGMGYRLYMSEETARRVYELFNQVYRTGESVRAIDYEIITLKGNSRFIETSISLIKNAEGLATGFRGIVRDVTERRDAEEALIASEKRFRAVFDTALDGLVIVDDEMRYLDANPAALRIFRMTREELLSHKATDFVKPENAEGFIRFVQRLKEEGRAVGTFTRKAGEREVVLEYTMAANFIPGQHVTVMRDVTEREEASRALAESEHRFRAVFDNALDAMVMVNDEMRVVDVNQAACELLGLTREQFIQREVQDFAFPGYEQVAMEAFETLKRNGSLRTTTSVMHPDHSVRITEFNAKANVLPGLHLSVNRDITDQVRSAKLITGQLEVLEMISTSRRIEDVLDRIAQLMEEVSSDLSANILLLDPEKNCLRAIATPSLPDELRRGMVELPIEMGMGSCTASVQQGRAIIVDDIATSPYWLKVKHLPLGFGLKASWSTPIHSANNEVAGTICILYREVRKPSPWEMELVVAASHLVSIAIERLQAEEKLRASEARFRAMIEKSTDGIILLNLQREITYTSPAFTRILGYEPEEVQGKPGERRIHTGDRREVMRRLDLLIERHGSSETVECQIKHKDGRWLWLEATGTNLLHDPDIRAVVVNFRDVTARKHNQELLKASEERFSKAFKASPIPVSISTLQEGRFVNVNDAWLKTMGFAKEEVIGRTSTEINFVIPSVPRQELIDRVRKESGVPNWEFDLRLRNGERRTFLGAVEIINLDGNEYFLVASQDITQRKLMEEKLRASEERFSKAFESSPLPLSISTLEEGHYLAVNQAWLDAMGYTREEVIGRTDAEINLNSVKVRRADAVERIKREGHIRDCEVVFRLRSGELRTFQLSVEMIRLNGEDHLLTSSKDITERKRAEERLRESEERYRSLFERNLAGVYKTSVTGLMLEGNQSFARMFGFDSFEEMRSTSSWTSNLNTEDRVKMLEKLYSQGRLNNYEMPQQRRDGTLIWTLSNITLVPGEDDEAEMLEGVVLDITDLKMAEEELRESRERYKALFEHSFVGICRTTLDGRILECNEALAKMFGYNRPEEMKVVNKWDLYFDPDVRNEMVNGALANKRFTNLERLMRRKDGTPVWTLSNGTLFESSIYHEPVLEGVFLDITDRKKNEDELKQHREQLRALSAKIESVREEERKSIAREIHDQLGQLMTGLKLEFAWVEKKIAQTEDQGLRQKLTPKMNEIDELLETTIQTVRDIASRLRPGHLDDLGLIAAIKWEAQGFSKRTGVKPDFYLCREPKNLSSDRATGLFRIFQEILTNVARHANATKIRIELTNRNGEIILVVEDDGMGIEPDRINSTKSLGLMGMRERALLLNGDVLIEPIEGKGTKVIVRIPTME